MVRLIALVCTKSQTDMRSWRHYIAICLSQEGIGVGTVRVLRTSVLTVKVVHWGPEGLSGPHNGAQLDGTR